MLALEARDRLAVRVVVRIGVRDDDQVGAFVVTARGRHPVPTDTIAITSSANGALPYGYLSINDTPRAFLLEIPSVNDGLRPPEGCQAGT